MVVSFLLNRRQIYLLKRLFLVRMSVLFLLNYINFQQTSILPFPHSTPIILYFCDLTKSFNIMKHLAILCLLITLSCFSVKAQTDSTHYDKTLADSLKADDYGMRMYYFVILKTGKNTSENKEEISTAFRGHLDNINKLVKEGKLIVAGPFGKNEQQYRGLFIFIAENKEEVEKFLSTDPAVAQSFLEAEIYDWYGSAALPTYLPYAEKISKKNP